MHSHSGQFCPGHAKDQLEDIILAAIAKGFTMMGLTEHMPRTSLDDLYPEEVRNKRLFTAVVTGIHALTSQPTPSWTTRRPAWRF